MKKSKSARSSGDVKVALIGAGAMANQAHYPSLAEFDDVEMVALCDLMPEKLKSTADRFGIRNTFTDYHRMLDETKPDAVYALMPPHHLFDVAMDVIQSGRHLFIEKPPGVTTFQTACLAKAAQDNNVITGVGFQRRYHPLFVRCHEETRKYGAPHQVVASFYKNMAPQETHPYFRGAIDILTADVIHCVDALRFFCGGEVKSVASDIRKIDCWYEICFNAIVAFENGCTGILMTNWRTGGRRLTMEMHSPGCSAFANADESGEVFADEQPQPVLSLTHTEAAESDAFHVHQGFRAQARAFIDGVKSQREVHNSLSDSVKTMKLVDMIHSRTIQ